MFGKQRMNGIVGAMFDSHKITTFTAHVRADLPGLLSG